MTDPPAQNDSLQVSRQDDSTFIDIKRPYETSKDTIRLNAIKDSILKFPEVATIDSDIRLVSKGKEGISCIIEGDFNGDSAYYRFMVGDKYATIYNFLVEKKTGQIKFYDPVLDTIISLKDWRSR